MRCVKVNRSSSEIKYEDNKTSWEADIIFNVYEKEIIILGTTRALSNKERNNIITEILNTYVFGNYLNKEMRIMFCKLKNRGLEKKEEFKQKNKFSYSIIGEEVLELSKNDSDSDIVKCLRNIYLNLKIGAFEYNKQLKEKSDLSNVEVPFEFYGSKSEYNYIIKIFNEIKDEFEDAISKYINHHISIEVKKGKLYEHKATVTFYIKEAN